MQKQAHAGASAQQWKGNTFGTERMLRWLIVVLRHSPVTVWYAFAAVCVVPFCLIFSPGAHCTYRYFRRRWQAGRLRAVWQTFVNHVYFSQVVIDKFALYAGKHLALKVEGYNAFKQLAARPEGFVMLSAHIGCFEMAGYELISDRKPFNALVYGGEKDTVMAGGSRSSRLRTST